jgi:hypothetical protein
MVEGFEPYLFIVDVPPEPVKVLLSIGAPGKFPSLSEFAGSVTLRSNDRG